MIWYFRMHCFYTEVPNEMHGCGFTDAATVSSLAWGGVGRLGGCAQQPSRTRGLLQLTAARPIARAAPARRIQDPPLQQAANYKVGCFMAVKPPIAVYS